MKQRCKSCGKPIEEEADSFPFCTLRCRMLDLGRWLDGSYRISRGASDDDFAAGAAGAPETDEE